MSDAAERYARLHEILNGARELRGAELDAFLEERCRDDAELEGDVRELLSAGLDETADAFADEGVAGMRVALEGVLEDSREPRMPEVIGGYRVVREIGRGGMGVVYEAEQLSPRRRVAIKLLNATNASEATIARFRRESDLLGRLQHSGIAQIIEASTYDAGEGPQPFFAMELVDGVSITEYADAHRLDVAERLELIAQVCDALEVAHGRGVVHRDLKPANILVTTAESTSGDSTTVGRSSLARPKILDFGVARAIDADPTATLRTLEGQLIGTVAYMSPEQALGRLDEIDARSDVYALGVIAYELLAGRLPYDVATKMVHAAVRVICEDEPTSLSGVDRALRGDVETIVFKALEKERERRYASAAELALGLRRYLSDRPIAARPQSTIYQVQKFARRNRALSVALGGLLLSLLAGITGIAIYALRADQQREAALEEARLKRQVNEILASILARSNPFSGGTDTRVADVLAETEDRLNRGQLASDPEVEGSLRLALARSYIGLSLYEDAIENGERALELLGAARGEDDPEVLLARQTIAQGTIQSVDAVRGTELAEAVWRAMSKVHGPDARETLRARSDVALGFAVQRSDEKALEVATEVYELRAAHLGERDEDTLQSQDMLANLCWEIGREREAVDWYQRTIDACTELHGVDHPHTLYSRMGLANALANFGRLEEALAESEELMRAARERLGDGHVGVAIALSTHARLLRSADRIEEAEELQQRVVTGFAGVFGEADPRTLDVKTTHGAMLRHLGRLDESEDVTLRALAPFEPIDENVRAKAEIAAALSSLGHTYRAQGRIDRGLECFERSLAMDLERCAPDHGDVLFGRRNLADLHLAEGRPEIAVEHLREVYPIRRETLGARHPLTIDERDLFLRALVALDTADAYLEAAAVLREAIAAREGPNDNTPERWELDRNLAFCLGRAGDVDGEVGVLEGLLRDLESAPDREAAANQRSEVEARLREL